MCSRLVIGLLIYVILWLVWPAVAGTLTVLALAWLISRLLIFFFSESDGKS